VWFCCCCLHIGSPNIPNKLLARLLCAQSKLLHPQQPTAFPQHNRASVLSYSNMNPCALQRMPCHSGPSQLYDASTCATAMTQAGAAQHQTTCVTTHAWRYPLIESLTQTADSHFCCRQHEAAGVL
jgi:hypothetical protein